MHHVPETHWLYEHCASDLTNMLGIQVAELMASGENTNKTY